MTDVLLINPSLHPNRQAPIIKDKPVIGSAYLPLALPYLGGYLEENGVKVRCIDARLYSDAETLQKIKTYLNEVNLVGFSVMTMSIPDALHLSDFIKTYDSDIKVVWGGIHPTLFPQQTVRDDSVDFVVYGEGEIPLLQLANYVKYGKPQLEEIPSLIYNKKGSIVANRTAPFLDVNKLPLPAYDLLEMDRYIAKRDFDGSWIRSLEIQTSRGCPHRCSFCVNTIVNKRIWRAQCPEKALDQLDKLISKYKLNHVIFLDENFFPNKDRAETILRGLIDYDISWIADCRADYLAGFQNDFLDLMKRSGCKGLFIGAESGSQRILRALKKDISIIQIVNAVSACAKYNIQPCVSIMIGLPNETKQDLLKTLELMKLLKETNPKLLWSGPQVFRPYPGGGIIRNM